MRVGRRDKMTGWWEKGVQNTRVGESAAGLGGLVRGSEGGSQK